MDSNWHRMDDLEKITDSYSSLAELARRLQADYSELAERFERQSAQLEEINQRVTDALEANNRLSAYLANILDSLDAGVIVFDTNGCINRFNRSAERLTGISSERAIGVRYDRLFDAEEHALTAGIFGGSEDRIRGEKWFGEQPVGYSVSKIYDNGGNCLGAVEILYDLSSEKKLRETISQVSALAALGEMSAIIAHQVRNPLAGVIGFANLLSRDIGVDHPAAPSVQKIIEGATEVNRIITNLLDFTRRAKPDYKLLDIVEFSRQTLESIRTQAFAANLDIKFKTDVESIHYRFDPLLFRQMYSNLIENAAQSVGPGGGALSLSVRMLDTRHLALEFADTGCGFAEQDPSQLFKPFYTTRRNGSGLGLSMVKRVVDFHNGVITAESPPGGGAVFTVILPL